MDQLNNWSSLTLIENYSGELPMTPTMTEEEVIDTFIEIEPLDQDGFLKVKETLTRIGIPTRVTGEDLPSLWQSCHVFHKRGKYYIVSFKQLFLLDGKFNRTDFTDEDYDRACIVANLLEQWSLVKLVDPFTPVDQNVRITVIPHRDKAKWNLRQKYSLGHPHN